MNRTSMPFCCHALLSVWSLGRCVQPTFARCSPPPLQVEVPDLPEPRHEPGKRERQRCAGRGGAGTLLLPFCLS